MRIVVNTNSLLTPLTGIGQYTYQIARALKRIDAANDYTYYYGFYSRELFQQDVDDGAAGAPAVRQRTLRHYQRVKSVLRRVPGLMPVGRAARTAASHALQAVRGRRFDLYFEPNFIPLEEIRASRTVTMVFDLSVLIHPEWHPADRVRIFERQFRRGIARSSRILTSTEFVKGQIVDLLEVAPERVTVTPISCDKDVFKPRVEDWRAFDAALGLPEHYLLFVGSVEPRKNILGLLQAYAALPPRIRDVLAIVLCGPSGWKNADVFQYAASHGLEGRIVSRPYLPAETLSGLYNRAVALVYPSFYEGFGLPPLEAMACGCPAIVSNIPTHEEVCADGVLYVDPHRPADIAGAIARPWDEPDLRQRLRAAGLARAAAFSWERAALATLGVFAETVSGPAPLS